MSVFVAEMFEENDQTTHQLVEVKSSGDIKNMMKELMFK